METCETFMDQNVGDERDANDYNIICHDCNRHGGETLFLIRKGIECLETSNLPITDSVWVERQANKGRLMLGMTFRQLLTNPDYLNMLNQLDETYVNLIFIINLKILLEIPPPPKRSIIPV